MTPRSNYAAFVPVLMLGQQNTRLSATAFPKIDDGLRVGPNTVSPYRRS